MTHAILDGRPAPLGPYGCHNRKPLAESLRVQDGWFDYEDDEGRIYRVPRMITINNPMTKECQYSAAHDDPRCTGCSARAEKISRSA